MNIHVTDDRGHKGPRGSEHALCDYCSYEWIAVHPCSEYLQCPICQKLSPSIVDLDAYRESRHENP